MDELIVEWYKKNFYDNLYDVIESKNDLVSNSIIASFITKSSVKRNEWLKISSKNRSDIPDNCFNELILSNYIRPTDELYKFATTAKGIWEIENNRSLLNYIDEKYFAIFPEEIGLTDKEKIALFAMIAARAFSLNSAVNLANDQKISDWWKEILVDSCDFLKSVGEIPNNFILFDEAKTGNQHPTNYYFSRLNNLNLKTKGIYKSPGERRYYLDLCAIDEIDLPVEKMSYLFSIIFKDKLTNMFILEIDNFCRHLSISKGSRVFDRTKHIFNKSKYSDQIKTALINSILK